MFLPLAGILLRRLISLIVKIVDQGYAEPRRNALMITRVFTDGFMNVRVFTDGFMNAFLNDVIN